MYSKTYFLIHSVLFWKNYSFEYTYVFEIDQNFKLNVYGVLLELYLEEIADRIIEVDMECQTDAFLDRPPTPLFIPAKTGKDVATQILEGEV